MQMKSLLLPSHAQEVTVPHTHTHTHPVDQLTNIVLEGHGVSHVTSGVELADLCPQLRELHLARNSLSDWQKVGLRSQRTHTHTYSVYIVFCYCFFFYCIMFVWNSVCMHKVLTFLPVCVCVCVCVCICI